MHFHPLLFERYRSRYTGFSLLPVFFTMPAQKLWKPLHKNSIVINVYLHILNIKKAHLYIITDALF